MNPYEPGTGCRPNPLAIAKTWLGTRLEERPLGYFLDGCPATLDAIMRETNRVLALNRQRLVTANPRWVP